MQRSSMSTALPPLPSAVAGGGSQLGDKELDVGGARPDDDERRRRRHDESRNNDGEGEHIFRRGFPHVNALTAPLRLCGLEEKRRISARQRRCSSSSVSESSPGLRVLLGS